MSYKLKEKRTEKRKPGKWIYPKTRKAIYLRDGHKCLYCGRTLEDGIQLSLDHLKPWIYFGSDRHTNLITCCRNCNSKRGDKTLNEWYKVLLKEEIATQEEIEQIKLYIRSIKRRSDSNIQKYRDIISEKKPYCRLEINHSLKGK